MDDQLQRLISELRKQSCPPVVMDRVAQRIAEEKAGTRCFAQAWSFGMAIVLLLVAFGVWQWKATRQTPRQAAAVVANSHTERARAAEQAAGALAYIGQVLLETTAHSENSILKKALPPLRDGLKTTRNKVIDRS
jgi:hypothetical protein